MEVHKNRYLVEITLVTQKTTFYAQGEIHEVFSPLDNVTDKIEKQIRHHGEKVKDWRHRLSQRDVATQLSEGEKSALMERDVGDFPNAPIPFFRAPEKFAPKPMNVEEAMIQLQTARDSLLLFLNAQTNQDNLIYKDRHGEYG